MIQYKAEVSDFAPIDFSGIDRLKVSFTHTITAKSEVELIRKVLDYMDRTKHNMGFHVYNDPIPFALKSYNKLFKLTYWQNLKPDEQFMLAGHVVLSKPWAKYKAVISFWEFPDQEP